MREQAEQLVRNIEEMARRSRFPVWVTDPDLAFTGAMRALGLTMPSGIALVFEAVEFSPREGVIQTVASCVATVPLAEWIRLGEAAPLVGDEELFDIETGLPRTDLDSVSVKGVSETYQLRADRPTLAAKGYPVGEDAASHIQALTYLICDTLPPEQLFSSLKHTQKAFDLDAATRALFSITRWQHPGTEIYEGDELILSRYPDLIEMVQALASTRLDLSLTGKPNTDWRDHL